MKTQITVAVIGGTGKSGKYLIKQLIEQNIPFKMLLRDAGTLISGVEAEKFVSGSVRDYKSVLNLIKGTDAVISMLGQPKDGPPIFSQATGNIIKVMEECGIKRYIVITGLSVDAAGDNKSDHVAAATKWMYTNYPATTTDKQAEYHMLTNSTINWTMIRLPLIEQTDSTVPIKISCTDCPGAKISAVSLANFIIKQLYNDEFIRKAPFIANA